MKEDELKTLATVYVAERLGMDASEVDSAHWATANTADLTAFAKTITARIVTEMRKRIALLQSHGQETAANAMENFTDELEEKRTKELEKALAACGTHHVNADTCGVCGLHFEQCEEDRFYTAGPPFDPAESKLACAGAVARQVLATKNV